MFRPGVFQFIHNLRDEINDADFSDSEGESLSDESDNDDIDYDDEDSSSDEQSNDSEEEDVNDIQYAARNANLGWSSLPPNQRGRQNNFNIIHEREGPAPHVRPTEINESLTYFLTDDMLDLIVRYTNQHGQSIYGDSWNPLCQDETKAFFGILYLMGVLRGEYQRLRDFWNKKFGQPSIIATMSRNRFQNILRHLRFDDTNTRRQRRADDKLASVRDLWNLFLRNCRRCIIPSPFLCVDEQLLPTRGRCPVRVYMANKPHKYGIKIWVLGDAGTGYFVDGDIYMRRVDGQIERNQGQRVVLQLCRRFFNSGRNITMDKYFSSIPLAQTLLQNGLTLLGTLNKNKAEVPVQFTGRNRELHSTLFGYVQNMQLVSYQARQTKFVLVLSTLHNDNTTDENNENKPSSITDYNHMKCPVDVLDQMANTFSVRRKIRRWPMTLLFNMLDLAAINAYITWILRNPAWKQREKTHRRSIFLKELALQLITPWMENRDERGANQPVGKRARLFILQENPLAAPPAPQDVAEAVLNRCHLCVQRKQIFTRCHSCAMHTCRQHSKPVCDNCR